MKKDETSWKRMIFKGNKVWIAIDQKGNFISRNGKVLMKYQLDQDYEYWVNEKGLKSVGAANLAQKGPRRKPAKRQKTEVKHKVESCEESMPADTIIIYTDGASSGNPGPAGIGVLFRYKKHEKEISRYIGLGTNNIAELEAIKTALLELKNTDLPVRIYTDSKYAYGLLAMGWKARKNQELVRSIKQLILKFRDLKFVKIKGHAGIEGNERADQLAISAIKKSKEYL